MPDPTLTFAVVSGSPSAEVLLASLCAELSRGLGRAVEPRLSPSYEALERELAEGAAHVVWAPPLVAVRLEDAGAGGIELCCTRGGEASYHAALFTAHASRVEKLADLEGCHMAWVDRHSAAGHLVPRMRLVTAGLDPERLFGRESFLGTHERVTCAVLEGKADAGATYLSIDPTTGRPMSAGWLEAGAGINGAFILATAGPIPSDAIVLSRKLPPELAAKLVEQVKALPAAAPEAVGGLLRADGFAPPRADHFEALRALVAARR